MRVSRNRETIRPGVRCRREATEQPPRGRSSPRREITIFSLKALSRPFHSRKRKAMIISRLRKVSPRNSPRGTCSRLTLFLAIYENFKWSLRLPRSIIQARDRSLIIHQSQDPMRRGYFNLTEDRCHPLHECPSDDGREGSPRIMSQNALSSVIFRS